MSDPMVDPSVDPTLDPTFDPTFDPLHGEFPQDSLLMVDHLPDPAQAALDLGLGLGAEGGEMP